MLRLPTQYQEHKADTRRQARTVEVQGTIAVQQPCNSTCFLCSRRIRRSSPRTLQNAGHSCMFLSKSTYGLHIHKWGLCMQPITVQPDWLLSENTRTVHFVPCSPQGRHQVLTQHSLVMLWRKFCCVWGSVMVWAGKSLEV